MNKDLDNRLTTYFPLLYVDRNGCKTKTAMCYGFACGDGWFDLIFELSEKLESIIKKTNYTSSNQPKAVQVKQKFGTLRFYMVNETDEMRDLIREAERRSKSICHLCGAVKEDIKCFKCK